MGRKFFIEYTYNSGEKEYKPLGAKGLTLGDIQQHEESTGARVQIRLLNTNTEGQPMVG